MGALAEPRLTVDPSFDMLRAMTQSVLEGWRHRVWSAQGFGFLRTYFGAGDRFRLNLWDASLRIKDVSTIHDHPWDFTSLVLCGSLLNRRYREAPKLTPECPYFNWMRIKTGPDGGPTSEGGFTQLVRTGEEAYSKGEFYRQNADDIHETLYIDGTVTLNDRRRRNGSEHARVFWPVGSAWVDAKPRPVPDSEIGPVVERSLAAHFR